MSTPTVPLRGPTSPSSSAPSAAPPSSARCPSGDDVLALEVTVRPEDAPAESVPVAWLGAPAAGGHAGTPATRSSSPAASAAGSSGPAGATQSRTEVVADRGRPHPAGGGGRARRCAAAAGGARRAVVTARGGPP